MPDEDDRAADPPQGASHGGDVAGERVEAVLGSDHLVPFRLKRGITLLKDDPWGQFPWTNTMLGLLRFEDCIWKTMAPVFPMSDRYSGPVPEAAPQFTRVGSG